MVRTGQCITGSSAHTRAMLASLRQAMSSVLCQHEDRVHSLVYVLIHEYGIEYPLDACSVAEYAHGSCSPSYLPEPPLDSIGRPCRLAKVGISKLKTGEQIFKIIPEALDGLGV